MKEDKLALKKAIESGDTDFIYLVLLHMRYLFLLLKTLAVMKEIFSQSAQLVIFSFITLRNFRSSPDMSLGKFLMILQNKDYQPAYHLFVQYCKERPERSQDLEYLYEQVIVVLCLFMLKKTL